MQRTDCKDSESRTSEQQIQFLFAEFIHLSIALSYHIRWRNKVVYNVSWICRERTAKTDYNHGRRNNRSETSKMPARRVQYSVTNCRGHVMANTNTAAPINGRGEVMLYPAVSVCLSVCLSACRLRWQCRLYGLRERQLQARNREPWIV